MTGYTCEYGSDDGHGCGAVARKFHAATRCDDHLFGLDKVERILPLFRQYWAADREDYHTTLADMLTDLMHLAEWQEIGFDDELSRARMNYQAERDTAITT